MVKKCGFDGVELILSNPNLLDALNIANEIKNLGLKVSTVTTGQATALEGISLTTSAEYIRQAAIKRMMDDIDFSVAVGKANVTIGLLRGKGDIANKRTELELLKIGLDKVVNYADKKGIVINLEPINRYECTLLNSCAETYEFILQMGNPKNLGILYDTFHSNIEDADMFETLVQIGKKISHVHFSDSNRRLPGEGHIDFPRIIKTLKGIGYNGYVSIETLNIPNEKHIIKNAKKSMDIL